MKKCYIDYVDDVKEKLQRQQAASERGDVAEAKRLYPLIRYSQRKAIADFTRCKTGEECCPGAIPGVPDYICDECMFGPGMDPVLTR